MSKPRIINENKFAENSDESNYWLGYIAADGCVSDKHNDISIKSKDKEHLQKLNLWLGNKIVISKVTENVNMLKFSNKEVKNYLIEYGITPRKSLTLNIKGKITWPFIRGVFDGDGNFRTREGSAELKITSSSLEFLKQIQEFFTLYDIKSYIRLQSTTKNPCYMIIISGFDFVKTFKYMYEGASVFLERKHLTMRPVFEKRQRKSGELLGSPIQDNQQPSSENDIKVSEKVQRIDIEESIQ